MIKITEARFVEGYLIRLFFSDGMCGDYDLSPLIERDTEMVRPLRDPAYFKRFFLELGALGWPNGFELSAGSIHRKLQESGRLHSREDAA